MVGHEALQLTDRGLDLLPCLRLVFNVSAAAPELLTRAQRRTAVLRGDDTRIPADRVVELTDLTVSVSKRPSEGTAAATFSDLLGRLLNELPKNSPARFHPVRGAKGMMGTSPWAIMDHSSRTTLAGIMASSDI